MCFHEFAGETACEKSDLILLCLTSEIQKTPLLQEVGLDGLARLEQSVHCLFQMVVNTSPEPVDHSGLDLIPAECGSDRGDLSDQPLHGLVGHVTTEKRLSLITCAEVRRHLEQCHPVFDKNQRVLASEDVAETAMWAGVDTWSRGVAKGLSVEVDEVVACWLSIVVLRRWPRCASCAASANIVCDTWHLS